jgi:hypothetical protein
MFDTISTHMLFGKLFISKFGSKKVAKTQLDKKNKNSDFSAPLTSFDWNEIDPNLTLAAVSGGLLIIKLNILEC